MSALMFRAMAAAGLMLCGAVAAHANEPLSGEYGVTETGQWFTILEFTSDTEVVLTMIGSEDRMEGTYAVEGDTVTVDAAGESRELTIDGNGCLDGGAGNSFFSGVICKKS